MTVLMAIGAASLTVTDARAQLTRVSVAADGSQANAASFQPTVSADGRLVAFSSGASNLVTGDTNNQVDVFVRDRQTNTTTRVSVTTGGAETTDYSAEAHISGNGRFVAFSTPGALVPGDTQVCGPIGQFFRNCSDVYVHDRQTGETTRVSVATGGGQGDGDSWKPSISGDGRYVAFESTSTNLVTGDTNGISDAFLHDRQTGVTVRVSPDPPRLVEPQPLVSEDGRFIAFSGFAPPSTLPPTDAGVPPVCAAAADPCAATSLYARETGGLEILSRLLPPSEADRRFFLDRPDFLSADAAIVVIRQGTVDFLSGHMTKIRTVILDRTTGRTTAGPWDATGDAFSVQGLSGDGRHYALEGARPSNPTPGQEWDKFTFVDRRTDLRETLRLVFPSAPGQFDERAASMSGDGRFAVFATFTAAIAADTNDTSDIYVLDRDTDGDGMLNVWETAFGLNPQDPADGPADADSDGIANVEEYRAASNPRGNPAFTRYLAEGAANAFFTTRLAVLNPGDAAAAVSFKLLGATGHNKTIARTIAARSRLTLELVEGGEAPENDFSTVIESDRLVVVDRTMTWDTGGFGAHAETAISAPSTAWFLAEGATHGAFDLFYLLQNANDAAAQVTVNYLRPSPLPPIVKTYTVAANSRRTIWVDSEGPDLAATDVSAHITADRAIIVERAMYFSTATQAFAAGHEGTGITTSASTWFLAEGATGQFFDLFLLIANPGTVPADVTVNYLRQDGAPVTKTYAIAAQSRRTISVAGEDPRLADTAVAMIVTAANSVPIVVERSMWWPHPNWYEGHLSAATTESGTRWALADGEVGGSDGRITETYVLIANKDDEAGSATVTLLPEGGGAPLTRTVPLPASSRVNVPLSELMPDAALRRFGILVESDGVGIVVERAMYTTVNNVIWAAGTSAVGTKLQ